MRVLPDWLQPLLTELTGKALPGEKPWFRWSRTGRLAATGITFLTGVGASMAFAEAGGGFLAILPVTWLLTLSASRTLQTGAGVHHASHGNLLTSGRLNELAGEAISLLTWIQPLSSYRKDHGPHHWQTGTDSDPDLAFLIEVAGLEPGLPVAAYWRRFWRTLFSPRFHAQFLRARLRSNLADASLSRRIAAWIWLIALGLAGVGGWGWVLFIGYLLPVLGLHQMSAWIGLLGLHQWVRQGDGQLPKKVVLAGLTGGRFVGEPVPSADLHGVRKATAWAGWTLRMVTLHLAARLAIVPGDLPSHDWHHFHPESPDWPNHAYARRDEALGSGPNSALYTEYWGVGQAIDATFRRLSALPRTASLGRPLTYDETQNGFLGM